MWDYQIYETSAITLSISATTGNILEYGKVIVEGTDTSIPEVYR
jgi:flagellar basal body L-ring protein FlgH